MTQPEPRLPTHTPDTHPDHVPSPHEHDPGHCHEYAHLGPVLKAYARREPDSLDRTRLREELIVGFAQVAKNLARRFAQRGVAMEDLTQVAMIGLINAVDHYDPDLSPEDSPHGGFLGYAIPTIRGEILRYFRDRTWSMRVPRRLKELTLSISAASARLSTELYRAPRPREIAAHLDIPVEEVLEGLQAGEAYTSTSLDQKLLSTPDEGASSLHGLLGQADARLEIAEDCLSVKPLLAALPERERHILMLRFHGGKSQTEIAQIIGCLRCTFADYSTAPWPHYAPNSATSHQP